MSEFGPAYFIKRKDGKEIGKKEQKTLLEALTEISQELDLKASFDEEIPMKPFFYDYDSYEEKSVSFVMYCLSIFKQMPTEVMEDYQEEDEKVLKKVDKEMDKKFPDTYTYQSYYVEV